jgi:hypothetical protein
MNRISVPLTIVACIVVAWLARPAAQTDVLQQIKAEALQHSQVVDLFEHLVTRIGPRLTGSPQHKAAADWSREKLASFGLENARLEPFEFGRGWALEGLVAEMTQPYYMPLLAYAQAWSPSTKGEIVGTPVFLGGKSAADVAALESKLAGAIVLSQPLVTAFVREDRPQPTTSDTPVRIGAPPMPRSGNQADTRAIAQTIREANAGVVIRSSAGELGTVFVLGQDQRENAIPTLILAAEHYNLLARMAEQNVPVKVRINLKTRYFTDDTRTYNVLADLPGTDAAVRDEVVLLGAHLDSWHSATGATDNADGSAAAMEAMRILKTIGARPRRTIRLALWSGEEEGLLGSRAHVKMHYASDAAAREKLSMYLNIDPGTGPIYGWYLENTAPARPLFDKWLEPLKDLGMRRNIDGGIGSTDHVSFREAGMPGFNPVQEYSTYDVRTHHTNVDTQDRVRNEDLRQNAAVLAWFAYNAAMTEEKLPRPEIRAR